MSKRARSSRVVAALVVAIGALTLGAGRSPSEPVPGRRDAAQLKLLRSYITGRETLANGEHPSDHAGVVSVPSLRKAG